MESATLPPLVWEALGDVGGYVEPFAGSAAVLLRRPAVKSRRVETINDADGWLVNTWRAIQLDPDTVAEHAYGPVTEADYHARLAWLQERRTDDLISWLEGDPEHYDAKAAGWWLYVSACGIGDPWGPGPWRVIDGHLQNAREKDTGDHTGIARSLPHLGTAGQGVNRALPDLGTAGKGINRALPHLGNAGRGVNRELTGSASSSRLEALKSYMGALATRLEQVRVTAGSWERALKPSVLRATAGNSKVGVFLDPPYATSGDVYASTNTSDEHLTISAETRQWCLQAPADLRIVLAGYESEHDELIDHGWTRITGKSGGGAGYNTNADAGKRERLWLSPSCVTAQAAFDLDLLA